MQLTRISFTGADDKVNPDELLKISLDFPLVEWAILFSQSKEGEQRYPTKEWRNRLYEATPNTFKAAHLCGTPMLSAFANADENLKGELTNFQRAQLNFNSKHVKPHVLEGLIKNVKESTFKYKGEYPIQIITQHNHSNQETHELFRSDNHVVLFDASGGHGVALSDIPTPIKGIRCGYAGGLSPDNMYEILTNLQTHLGETPIWIDMESGVRTNNEFDLGKVREVIQIVKDFQLSTYNTIQPGM